MLKQKFKDYLTPLKEERERSLKYEVKKVDMREILAKSQLQKSQNQKDKTFLSHMAQRYDMKCTDKKRSNAEKQKSKMSQRKIDQYKK
jgi:hypothetical protein